MCAEANPEEVSDVFSDIHFNVSSTVQSTESAIDQSLSPVFEQCESSMKLMLTRIERANKFNVQLKAMQSKVYNRINQFQQLTGMLWNSLKMEDIRTSMDAVQSIIDKMQSMLGNCPVPGK